MEHTHEHNTEHILIGGAVVPDRTHETRRSSGLRYSAETWAAAMADYRRGDSAREVAARYGMTASAVYHHAARYGFAKTVFLHERAPARAAQFPAAAVPDREILRQLAAGEIDDLSEITVPQILGALVGNAKNRIVVRRHVSKENKQKAAEEYNAGLTGRVVSDRFGISESSLRRTVSDLGLTKTARPAPTPDPLPPEPEPPPPPPPWEEIAHDAQKAPVAPWRTWLFQGGRGAGKTRAGAEWFDALARATPKGIFALVGATYHDVREVMIDGESRLMNLGRGDPPCYEVARRRLRYTNGAVAFAYSAEESRRLRGPQFHGAWADEFCAWNKPSHTLSNLRLALRRGDDPRLVITTTPKAIPELRALHGEKGCVVTRAGSDANADNLSPAFIEHLRDIYGDTPLARQELDGVMLDDAPGVMWTHQMLRDCRGATPVAFERVIVAVDPPAGTGGSACGIIVAARREGRGHVLADYSVRDLSPLGWARRVCEAARDYNAVAIVAESNQGGDMVRATLAGASPVCGIELVRAFASKTFRAAPVSMLYERGRVTHCGDFAELEEEMMAMSRDGISLNRNVGGDRVDALVWALSHLLVDVMPAPQWRVRRL